MNVTVTPSIIAKEFLLQLHARLGDVRPVEDDGRPRPEQIGVDFLCEPEVDSLEALTANLITPMAWSMANALGMRRPFSRPLPVPKGAYGASENYDGVSVRVIPWRRYDGVLAWRIDTLVADG